MPDHRLHPYFRFLVDHQELIQSDVDGKTESEDQKANTTQHSVVGGALSLLGSVYGSGEDEDSAVEGGRDDINIASDKTVNANSERDSHGSQKAEFSPKEAEKDKDGIMDKHPLASNKEKAPVLKKNPSIAASKTGITNSMKQKDDSGLFSCSLGKTEEPLVLEPPSGLKRLIDKIVEFIVKNGKQFETTLREQDTKHGRFPFLLPSNQYHPYYLKVLQGAEESKVGARSSFHGRDDLAGRNMEKRGFLHKDNDASSLGFFDSDLPFESDRKEKFKMVIGKGKKDMQDPPSKAPQQEFGINVDAAAAAAILQAATRGIRYPDLGILSSISVNGSSHGQCSQSGQVSDFRSQASSQLNGITKMSDEGGRCNSSVPVAQTDKGAVAETAGAVDSSEAACLTREQQLKAERLRRAKMFVAKLKSGAGPSTAETSHTLSMGAIERGPLEADKDVNLVSKAKEGSAVPTDSCIPDESENTGRKHLGDEYSERRLRRKYRLRSHRHDMDDENDDEEDPMENYSGKRHQSRGSSDEGKGGREKDDDERAQKHSKRKHRSRHSSYEEDHDDDDDDRKDESHKQSRKKHRSRHHSHQDDEEGDVEMSYNSHSNKKRSSHRSSHEGDDKGDREDEKHKHSRRKSHSHRERHKHRKESHRRSKHESSSDTDHKNSHKHRKESHRRSKCESSLDMDRRDSHKHRKEESHHKHEVSSDTDHRDGKKHRKESNRRSKYEGSSDTEHKESHKRRKGSHRRSKHESSLDTEHRDLVKEDLEEGEISSKVSGQSRGSVANGGSMQTSTDIVSTQPRAPSQPSATTEISDDLRAKIRAMLLATR